MLVLSRKVGEKIILGNNTSILVSRIAGNRVTIAVEAPADVKVIRGELVVETDEPTEEEAAIDTEIGQ